MRTRALIVDLREEAQPVSTRESRDTYDHVRRTLDDALAELELPADRHQPDAPLPVRF